jgi:hypothetical protein
LNKKNRLIVIDNQLRVEEREKLVAILAISHFLSLLYGKSL